MLQVQGSGAVAASNSPTEEDRVLYTDYMALTTAKANGAKGEGIAGTPRYINNNWASPALDNIVEGYRAAV